MEERCDKEHGFKTSALTDGIQRLAQTPDRPWARRESARKDAEVQWTAADEEEMKRLRAITFGDSLYSRTVISLSDRYGLWRYTERMLDPKYWAAWKSSASRLPVELSDEDKERWAALQRDVDDLRARMEAQPPLPRFNFDRKRTMRPKGWLQRKLCDDNSLLSRCLNKIEQIAGVRDKYGNRIDGRGNLIYPERAKGPVREDPSPSAEPPRFEDQGEDRLREFLRRKPKK